MPLQLSWSHNVINRYNLCERGFSSSAEARLDTREVELDFFSAYFAATKDHPLKQNSRHCLRFRRGEVAPEGTPASTLEYQRRASCRA